MRNLGLICIGLTIIILAVYIQVGNHQFLDYDDSFYVTNNQNVAHGITGQNFVYAFTSVDTGNWHPITWLSHMADVQFYGMNPRGHHLTNVVIHTISSLLLALLLFRLTGTLWQSAFVAAMFALHPLHVESVAWVAERRDVLSAFFWFLTLLMYAEFTTKRKPTLYISSLISFMFGLMSKPMLVTLPIVMLLMDFWPLNRYQQDEQARGLRQFFVRAIPLIKEKIPFFACSLLLSIVTVIINAQPNAEAMSGLNEVPFLLRIENALTAYVKYMLKTLWPHDLAVLYPLTFSIPLWQVISSLLILLLISVATIRAGRKHSYLAVGWFWFLITLVPVIGLIQVGIQSMADRYSYISVIGLFIMVAWGIPEMTKGLQHRKGFLALLAGAVIISSTALTWQQIGYWQDNISLFQHTLHVTTGNFSIHNNLGTALAGKGEMDAAIREFQQAIQIRPGYAEAHNNLGGVLVDQGDVDAGIHELKKALWLKPDYAYAHYNLGHAYAGKGHLDAAIEEYQRALLINPDYSPAHINLGIAFAGKGQLDAAIKEYHEAIRINSNHTDAHFNLGLAFARKGDQKAATLEYQEALRISPNCLDAHFNLGVIFADTGQLDAAIKEYQAELRINPNNANAYSNLELSLAKKRMQ